MAILKAYMVKYVDLTKSLRTNIDRKYKYLFTATSGYLIFLLLFNDSFSKRDYEQKPDLI